MTGIFLFAVMGVWLVAALSITVFITRKMSWRMGKFLIRASLLIVLIPLPLIDEIVGGRQFARLCKENSTIQVDRANAAGRTVYLADDPDTEIKGVWVPVRLQQWRFVDVTTRSVVVSYNELHATGGIFIRMLGISEGNVPMTFKDSCAPGGQVNYIELFKELRITQVQRATLNQGSLK